jgi:two-component system, response regulator YesN
MQMRVLIVDDEERQRSGLIRHIDWNAYGMMITGEAESAQQALELAAENPPDLLITDIRLIGTDGLELSRSMRTVNKDLQIIMITGFEDFDYAKSAIGIGIEAFLLKPIDFPELAANLKRIGQSFFMDLKKHEEDLQLHEQLKEILPIAREKLLHELISGLAGTEEQIRTRTRYLQMFESGDTHAVIVVMTSNDGPLPHDSEENAELAYLKIKRIAEEVLSDVLETITTLRGDSILIVNCSVYPDFYKILEQKLEGFHHKAEMELGCKIDIGIGPAVDSLQRIADSFRLAQRAINHRLLQGTGQIMYWNDTGGNIYSSVEIDSLIVRFFEGLRLGDRETIDNIFDSIIRRFIESDTITESEAGCRCLELVSGASRIMAEMGETSGRHAGFEKELWKRLLDCDGLIQMLKQTKEILMQACDYIAERKRSRYRSIVQGAIDYIGAHFYEDLTLQDVAGKVYLSPSYLGSILRAELKQSFTEYLAGVRIDRAKELLRNPQYKLYEISEQVGYQNPAYFCNVFKRYTGMSPKEFRNSQDIVEYDQTI